MDSQQTPRASEDPNAGRGSSPMGKQNPALPPGFQTRPQGPPPLSPRYPLNNGSVGGARLGGQQPLILHRLDSRSSLGSPTAQGGQFVQSRPPFGPPRPQNPQGIQIQGPRPPPTSNPQSVQGPPRYPPGTPGVRPPPNNFVGPRPPIYNSNQPQQVYYQPRNGDIRPQRPPNPEPGATPQIRFAPNPYNSDTRQQSPQVIPDTVVTPPPRNDWQLRDERVVNQSRPPPVRESVNEKRTQPFLRQGLSREKMDVIDSRSPTPGAQIAEQSRGLIIEENDKNVPKRKTSPRGENDDDDDDVVMDSEKPIDSKSPIREKIATDTLQPEVERVDSPSSPVSSASQNSIKKSGSPSPIPPATLQDRPNSVNKLESSDQPPVDKLSTTSSPVPSQEKLSTTSSPVPPQEKLSTTSSPVPPQEKLSTTSSPVPPQEKLSTTSSPVPPQEKLSTTSSPVPPQDKLSTTSSPVPPQDKSGVPSRSESRLGDSTNADLSIGDGDVGESESNDTDHKDVPILDKRSDSRASDVTNKDDSTLDKRSDSRASDVTNKDDSTLEKRSDSRASIQSSRSPIPSGTPDHQTKLSVPGSATPQTPNSPKSPKSPKSPQGSVKGFDNGQLRSLSPKSPTPSVSPASPNSPNSPAIPKSAEREKKTTTFVEDTEPEMQEDTKQEEGDTGKNRPMTPGNETRGRPPTPSKALERAQTPGTPDGRKSSMKRSTSGRSIKSEAGSDSGANQTTPAPPTTNGVSVSPTKKIPPKSREAEKRSTAASPTKSPSKSVKSLPRTPETGPPSTGDKKKVPMNKVQVGAAPSPNLKTVRSKIGSLDNASYKPGGGKVKIENRKLDFSKAQPKIAAKNDKYTPSGGDKKITQVKLQWNAKPKVGSLDNATYKPGGGDKKIETVKLDFKDKAKPKVGSKDNAKHVPGGGTVKSPATPPKTPMDQPNEIETQKIDIKAESKIGSMDNVKHKPGGGDKKIFNDRDYLRQSGSNVESLNGSGAQIKSSSVAERPSFIEMKSSPPEPNPPPTTPTRSRPSSAVSPVTPSALRTSLQAKTPDSPGPKRVTIAEELRSTNVEVPTSARKSPEGQQTPRRARTPRSPGSSRPPSSLNLKAVEKSPNSSRKTSPKGVHLPKLTPTQSLENSEQTAPIQEESNVKLPKLMQTSMLSSRLELAQ